MKVLLKNILVVIGLISVCNVVFGIIKRETDAREYLENCEKVRPGMSLAEAKKRMGDYDNHWYANPSHIWTHLISFPSNTLTEAIEYQLNYPAPFGASSGTEIFFDPTTQLVIRVRCGEGFYTEKAR